MEQASCISSLGSVGTAVLAECWVTWRPHFRIISRSRSSAFLGSLVVNIILLWSIVLGIMKILALHGLGASGAMLKAQLAPFIKSFGAGYQFVFLDGAIPCGRGPGMLSHLCTDISPSLTFDSGSSLGIWAFSVLRPRFFSAGNARCASSDRHLHQTKRPFRRRSGVQPWICNGRELHP